MKKEENKKGKDKNTKDVKEHEITFEVTTNMNTLVKILETNGFKRVHSFIVEDRYMLPVDEDIDYKDLKETLNKAVKIRHLNFIDKKKTRNEINKKVKEFDKNGNILKEKTFICIISDINDAYELFKALGYKEILHMNQKLTDYVKDKELITTCEMDDKIYIEIENKTKEGEVVYYSVEEMIEGIKKYNIPHDESNYFKQKAVDKLKEINSKE